MQSVNGICIEVDIRVAGRFPIRMKYSAARKTKIFHENIVPAFDDVQDGVRFGQSENEFPGCRLVFRVKFV